MNCSKVLSNEIGEVIENIKESCAEFYSRHEKLLYSIVLTGSLARREVSKENGTYDADILVVTRYYYNPILGNLLRPQLKKKIRKVEFDFGRSYPLSRLRREKSLFLYDIKNNGVILAGNDVRRIIQEHSLNDLYPFEGIRLLLNAACRLVFSFSQEEAETRKELNKAMKCCIDAYLLHHGQFASTANERNVILKRDHLNFFKKIQAVIECDDLKSKYLRGRQELLNVMNLITLRLELGAVRGLVDYLRARAHYSFPFKLYTLAMSRNIGAIFRNPIFDVYAWILGVLEKCEELDDIELERVRHDYFQNIWIKLPQPVVYA